jgi:hypothetical protein
MEEAHTIAAELHGHAINVGSDLIAIEVANDVIDSKTKLGPKPGNGERRRPGRGQPAANQ